MSIEQLANNALTTLAAAIGADDTTLSVTSHAAFPSAAQFRVLIQSELILVTGGAGSSTWTVTRGIEGTSPAAHAPGAVVAHVLTAGALDAFVHAPSGVTPGSYSNADITVAADGRITSAASRSRGSFGAGLDYLVPLMTGPTTDGVTVSETSYYPDSGADTYRAWRAMTRTTLDAPPAFYHSATDGQSMPQIVSVQLPTARTLKGYRWRGYAVDPSAFAIDGSNNGTDWVTLDEQSSYANVPWPTWFERFLPFQNRAFTSYRFRIIAAWDGSNTPRNYVNMLNIDLIGE